MSIEKNNPGQEDIDHPEEKEGEPGNQSIWIVDDNAEHINSLLRALKYQAGEGFQFSHFQEGERATIEFEKLAEEKSLMPGLILMDYKLDEKVENPKFKTGVEVIEELKRIAAEHEVKLPDIAAFSSEKDYAKQLLEAGASTSLNKMDYMAVVKYLKTLQVVKQGE